MYIHMCLIVFDVVWSYLFLPCYIYMLCFCCLDMRDLKNGRSSHFGLPRETFTDIIYIIIYMYIFTYFLLLLSYIYIL